MDKELESLLAQVSEKLESHGARLALLEDSVKSSPEFEDKGRITELEAEVARLSDRDHERDLVSEWALGLDRDAYLELGVKLGYVEEVADPGEDDEGEEAEVETEEPADTVEGEGEPEAEAEDSGEYIDLPTLGIRVPKSVSA